MTRKELIKKYEDGLKEMGALEAGDFDTLLDKLIYEVRVNAGELSREDTYRVPASVNLVEFYADYKELANC